jgi:hypothetical protein
MATKKTTKSVKKPMKSAKKVVKKTVKKVVKKAAKKKTSTKKKASSKKKPSSTMKGGCGPYSMPCGRSGEDYCSTTKKGDCNMDSKCGSGPISKMKGFVKNLFSN